MAKPIKVSSKGRKCEFPECEQTLSIYNHKTYCRKHWDKLPQDDKTKNRHYHST